jgi:hypothetical protein
MQKPPALKGRKIVEAELSRNRNSERKLAKQKEEIQNTETTHQSIARSFIILTKSLANFGGKGVSL